MRTVVLGVRPAELEAAIERRRASGGDLYDEIWEGEYHMAPAAHPFHGYLDDEIAALLRPLAQRVGLVGTGPFNLGAPDDYRVPDRGLHRQLPRTTWVPTAAMVVEILSPDDESLDKLAFYAAHGVEEVLVIDGEARRVRFLVSSGGGYGEASVSSLLGVAAAELAVRITWP
ncbi:MAG: Uma2 family endonuclease [Acidimicrobiales bacterium]